MHEFLRPDVPEAMYRVSGIYSGAYPPSLTVESLLRSSSLVIFASDRDGRPNRPGMKSGVVSLSALGSSTLHNPFYCLEDGILSPQLFNLLCWFAMEKKRNSTTTAPVAKSDQLILKSQKSASNLHLIESVDNLGQNAVETRILTIRGENVILDNDLAMLYGTETKRLNEQVNRNIGRFPTEFMFQLNKAEYDYLRSHFATANWSKRRSLPYAFTEHGVIMAAAILKSEIADRVSVTIVKAFVAMRRFLAANALVFQRLETIEYKLLESDQKFEDIYSKLEEKSLQPKQGIFFDGQIYDAYEFVSELIKIAKTRIVLIDNYVDDTVLTMLDKREKGVSATVYTKQISQQLRLDITKHNAQYPVIDVKQFAKSHDRFLIIDNQVYLVGASLKDLGKKWFAFSLMSETDPDLLLSRL